MTDPALSDVTIDPNSFTMPAINFAQPTNYAPYLTLFGGGMSAASMYGAGQGSAALLRANAGIAQLQSRSETELGEEQSQLYRQHLAARMGAQQTAVGAGNVTMSGSPLRALESTSFLGAQDVARIRTNAARRAWGFDVTAAGDEMRARQASAAGTSNAIGSLITSGSRAYGQWSAD